MYYVNYGMKKTVWVRPTILDDALSLPSPKTGVTAREHKRIQLHTATKKACQNGLSQTHFFLTTNYSIRFSIVACFDVSSSSSPHPPAAMLQFAKRMASSNLRRALVV